MGTQGIVGVYKADGVVRFNTVGLAYCESTRCCQEGDSSISQTIEYLP